MLPAVETRGDLPWCGYVVMVDCLGCAPSKPTGGCFCGPNSGSFDCRKISGGIQTDIKTICHNGLAISTSGEAPCSVNQKCMKADGSQTNCAEMGLGGLCRYPSGGEAPCDWRTFGSPQVQPTFQVGDPCDPGSQN